MQRCVSISCAVQKTTGRRPEAISKTAKVLQVAATDHFPLSSLAASQQPVRHTRTQVSTPGWSRLPRNGQHLISRTVPSWHLKATLTKEEAFFFFSTLKMILNSSHHLFGFLTVLTLLSSTLYNNV